MAPVRTCADVGNTDTPTAGDTVTIDAADFVVSATDVAVTETCAGVGGVDGAEYTPVEETAPQVAPLQPAPLAFQVTAVFVVFRTVAVSCFCSPAFTVVDVGETLTDTGNDTVTILEADFEGSATDVAVTVTCAGAGWVPGAV